MKAFDSEIADEEFDNMLGAIDTCIDELKSARAAMTTQGLPWALPHLDEVAYALGFKTMPPDRVPVKTPRFPYTECSQCGNKFGPGNEGFSSCRQHRALRR